jgi:arylsulfatase A-like enzyme
MRKGRWKLRLADDTTQLFNLQTDPGEQFNRVGDRPELAEEMRAQMKAFADSVGAQLPDE